MARPTKMSRASREHWSDFIKAHGMQEYFPDQLSLQDARTMRVRDTNVQAPTKEELPWKVLQQIMFMNTQCREDAVNKFKESVTPKEVKIPHPMDMILLLFTSSDYMLRQVLAHKLFMCRLAIPFIIPTAENTVRMMLWPLRSIILEWRNSGEAKEEALVKCKFNMVAFMRYGKTNFSKSYLLNELLSSPGHPTFFHKGSPCGNEKRLISNGTVELSHFLPGGSQRDIFKDPALFFNLRGDACDHPVQHSVLRDLATVLVIVVDIGEFHNICIQKMLKSSAKKKNQRLSIVVTRNKRPNVREKRELKIQFDKTVEGIIPDEDTVTTFNEYGEENMSTVSQNVRTIISRHMMKQPKVSLEEYALSHSQDKCIVDERSNDHCITGKEVANRIMTEINNVDYPQRREMLLPNQGPCLTEFGQMLRKLHRASAQDKEAEASDSTIDQINKREKLKSEIYRIRMEQANATVTVGLSLMDRIIELFQEQKDTSKFAIRFLQLELDAISRSLLPGLQRKKNEYRIQLTETRGDENAKSVTQGKIQELEENIAAATLGWEHLMREVGQVYVSSALKNSRINVSSLRMLVGKQLLNGHPIELMDGDHSLVHITWVEAVFQALSQQVGETKKIFVLSVVGVQSSGKSTLLNTMFGLEFAVSAGRCTRGIYAQLLPVNENHNLPFDYMLVLDSEGLRCQQREKNIQYDNELATLAFGLSDLTLVNVKGENISEMADVLQIVVQAFLRMKVADSPHKRRCMIIHQNVNAVNAHEKLADDRQRLAEQLDRMTKQASIAQGLADVITAFNQIIEFDSEHDVVYYSDLLSGEPPMATINQGYSDQAANTQQRILQDIGIHFKNSITIPDFIMRVDDIWKGVLSDDFIFSFRNTLSAKAYIEVEREFADQTFKIKQELLDWMTKFCKVEISNCQSVDNLAKCCENLKLTLNKKVDELVAKTVAGLHDFFENHSASEIIVQWKEEKVSSIRIFGQTLAIQTEVDLINMKDRKLFELHQNHDSEAYKKKIIEEVIAFAEDVRDKHLSEEELQTQFDNLWKNCTARLPVKISQNQKLVMCAFQNVLHNKFSAERCDKYLRTQLESTPLLVCNQLRQITEQDITEEYIILKESESFWNEFKNTVGRDPSWKDYVEGASRKANHLLDTVMKRVERICSHDAQFKDVHGREIVDLLWGEIDLHNKSPPDKAAFAITPEFKAMLAVHVTSCAISKFEQMNQRFEKQHGLEAQMKRLKDRMFRLFKNIEREESAEVIASGDFCEVLNYMIYDYVLDDLKQNIPKRIQRDLSLKSDLVIQILREIAQEGSFTSFHGYVSDPIVYAKAWFAEYCNELLFSETDGQTKCTQMASGVEQAIFSLITKAVSDVKESTQYEIWIDEYCTNMEETIPVKPIDLKITACTVTNLSLFKKLIDLELLEMQETVRNGILEATGVDRCVEWLHDTYDNTFQRVWGCPMECPFCKEPCKLTDLNHSGPHRCVQHKPSGIVGMGTKYWLSPNTLHTETCDWLVASEETFRCEDIEYQCFDKGKCTGLWQRIVRTFVGHTYNHYKTYLPDWDIAPDASGEACKYWKWAMCFFQEELLQKYPRQKLHIPESWKQITKQEAIDNLYTF